jgi:acyl carrier protein
MKREGDERTFVEARFADRLRCLPSAERRDAVTQFVLERVAIALGIEAARIPLRANLLDLGVDSLKAVELKSSFEGDFDLALSGSLLFDYPTLDGLAGFLLAESCTSPAMPIGPSLQSQSAIYFPDGGPVELLAREIDELKSTGAI